MPPIRSAPPIKPMKTERTHEENQERAYIAASRRSDRSLEARIESARRASEIHKKRTGRALRVTEQDVINEEMYEEEDEETPSQYQRLSAHLHTNSMLFNKKLQDYIATQAAVRQSFLAQYQQPPFTSFGQPMLPTSAAQFAQGMSSTPNINQFVQPQTPLPQGFNQNPQPFNQPSQSATQQMYRTAPYSIPARHNNSHQRSASMSVAQQQPPYPQSTPYSHASIMSPQMEEHRRMSLPPTAFQQAPNTDIEASSRPPLSRSSTAQSAKQQSSLHIPTENKSTESTSPPSAQSTPALNARSPSGPSGMATPDGLHFTPGKYFSRQAPPSDLLSLSLPPESQQLVAQGLDPSDPTAAMFMAGSENIALPMPTYHYNPNLSPKSSRMVGKPTVPGPSATHWADSPIKKTSPIDSMAPAEPTSAMSEDFMSQYTMSGPSDFDFLNSGELFQGLELPPSQDDFDTSSFVNFD